MQISISFYPLFNELEVLIINCTKKWNFKLKHLLLNLICIILSIIPYNLESMTNILLNIFIFKKWKFSATTELVENLNFIYKIIKTF